MNAQERKAALQEIYKLSGYYNSIGGIFGIDQWSGLPEEGLPYRLEINAFLHDQRRTLYFTPEAESLGNIYDGMIYQAICQDLPDFEKLVENGQFSPIIHWLTENIWQYGQSVTAMDLLRKFGRQGLDAQPLLDYLDRKFGKIYGWKQ